MIRLAVLVPQQQAEIVLAELLDLAPGGVEERHHERGMVEFAIYGAPGELPALPDLNVAVGDALVEVSSTEIADDWDERWKRFHTAVLVEPPAALRAGCRVPAIRIRPPWEAPADGVAEEVEDIVIDPGQAFGTGAHATTRLCLELLLEIASRAPHRGHALVDVGTGSGVLAIAAARLGFRPVVALDNDRESVRAARANAEVNDARIDVRRFDLRSETLPWPQQRSTREQDLVLVANLLRPLLLDLARGVGHEPRHLVAGGLLATEADDVAGTLERSLGLSERDRRIDGEWAALWLARN